MPTFAVTIREVHATYVEIEASSEDEALEIASNCLCSGQLPNGDELPDPIYDYTLDTEHWSVYEI